MAKLTAPLFSLKASGQLGKSLVYLNWKGINDVRTYVIPANPKSNLQNIQRGYMIDGVDMWHANAWNAADLTAFNNWAGVSGAAMSGFNRVIKEYIYARTHAGTWHAVLSVVISLITTTGFKITAAGSAAVTFECHYGTSPTAMVNTEAVANAAGVLTVTLAGLTANVVYFAEIVPTTAAEYGRTGIVRQKTAAA